ncbi:MAG: hypothetical protein D6785_00195 [Planctomycetota bacterium]|nr:MAG: hypothetical protein D6785_00195 [Planctomycetota bacterium]
MKHHLQVFLFSLLFIAGCGAVITGVGIMLGSQSSSSSSSAFNTPPVVLITSPSSGEEKNDLITIEYQLFDNESNGVNVLVEWKRKNDTTWNLATELKGDTIDTSSSGTTNLTSSPTGTAQAFVWNSMVDIPAANVTDIVFRITPTDVVSGITGKPAEISFKVMNTYSTTLLGRIKNSQNDSPYHPIFFYIDKSSHRLYFSNKKNFTIASLDLTSTTTLGASKHEIGTGLTPFNGDNLLGTGTNVNTPTYIAEGRDLFSFNTSLYFCDALNHRIRSYDLTTGFISTVVGSGLAGYNEDNPGPNIPTAMDLNTPYGISTIPETTGFYSICFSELGNRVIRYVNYSTSNAVFYSGSKIQGVTDQTLVVSPNTLQTIVGNPFRSLKLVNNDGPIWTSDNTSVTSTEQIGLLVKPTKVVYAPTPVSQKRLLYLIDGQFLRIVNLEGSGQNITLFPNASFIGETPLTVTASYLVTFLGNPLAVNKNFLTNGSYAPKTFSPSDIMDFALAANGDTYDIYFTEGAQNRIWRIDGQTGQVSIIAGDGEFGGANPKDGNPATQGSFAVPMGLAVDSNFMYVADHFGNRIRAINLSSQNQTILGKTIAPGYVDTIFTGPNIQDIHNLIEPEDIVVDSTTKDIFVADRGGHKVIQFNFQSRTGQAVVGNGKGTYAGDGGNAKNASIGFPEGIALWNRNGQKLLFVGDNGEGDTNSFISKGRVRIINFGTNATSFGHLTSLGQNQINTLVGGGSILFSDPNNLDLHNQDPLQVRLGTILDVFTDTPPSGSPSDLPLVYIIDQAFQANSLPVINTYRLLVYNPNSTSRVFQIGLTTRTVNANTVSTLAVWRTTNPPPFSGPMRISMFKKPGFCFAVGGAASNISQTTLKVIVPVQKSHVVLGLNFTSQNATLVNQTISAGSFAVLAGTGSGGYNGDVQLAVNAKLNSPHGVFYSVDSTNSEVLGISDTENHRFRVVFGNNPPKGFFTGEIITLIGTGVPGYNGDNRPPTSTMLFKPVNVALLPVTNFFNIQGVNIFIVEEGSGRVRIISLTD